MYSDYAEYIVPLLLGDFPAHVEPAKFGQNHILRGCLGGHPKTGQSWTLQNRPTDRTQDMKLLYRADGNSSKSFPISLLGPGT